MISLNFTLVMQIINFLIFLLILWRFAYRPLVRMLDQRRAKIEGDLSAAQKEREQAERLSQEVAAQLADGRRQVQEMLDRARKTMEQEREQALAATKAEQQRMLRESEQEIAMARDRALAEIRREIVGLALACAGKIIQDKLDEKSNAAMVEAYIDRIGGKDGRMPC
ncbi:MAG: F0F1 ATP synthase subunit B [Negativicutes bacterium]|nr:F0F1 ATP synthase subunit B [Negativicutes bacterium]